MRPGATPGGQSRKESLGARAVVAVGGHDPALLSGLGNGQLRGGYATLGERHDVLAQLPPTVVAMPNGDVMVIKVLRPIASKYRLRRKFRDLQGPGNCLLQIWAQTRSTLLDAACRRREKRYKLQSVEGRMHDRRSRRRSGPVTHPSESRPCKGNQQRRSPRVAVFGVVQPAE